LTVAPTLVAYVSGHGFGHSVRTATVLAAVRALDPGLRIAVVTAGPEIVFREALGSDLLFRRERADVGLVQKGALVIDTGATVAECEAFDREMPARVEREAAWLRDNGARLVLGDIPPLAFAAAAKAGVPGVGMSNFSWDWIYRHLSRHEPRLSAPADAAARAYAQATNLLQLPFAGDLAAFPRRTPIPLVVRRPSVTRLEGRRRLGLGMAPAVLLSFGGLGLPGLEFSVLSRLRSFQFLSEPTGSDAPPNVRLVSLADLAARGLTYLDLVAAADVVVTKPGYGIVTDAIASRTRMVYTERGDFPEYPILVEGMTRWLPAVHVSNADLLAGHLRPALDAVLAAPFPDPPRMDGAAEAARALLEEARITGPPTPGRPSRTA
jgi:L-arabinokinase